MPDFDTIPSATITADIGEGLVTQDVTSWSVSRSLSGGGLPGQARAASGSSVGQGTVSVESPAGRTPWSAGPIKPGGKVALDASEDVGVAASPQGRMIVRRVGGPSALSNERTLDIEDDLGGMRGPIVMPEALADGVYRDEVTSELKIAGVDAAWAIDVAARAGGFYTTPPPVASAVMSAPLAGTFTPEVGTFRLLTAISAPGWSTVGGSIYATGGGWAEWTFTKPIPVRSTLYVTLDSVWLSGGDASFSIGVDTVFESLQISLTQYYWGVGGWSLYPPRATPRIQFRITTSGPNVLVAARGSYDQAWSADRVFPIAFITDDMSWTTLDMIPRTIARRGIQVHTEDDPAVWALSNARIAASGSPLNGVVGIGSRGAWDVAQEVAAATMGAIWIDETGVLTYRNRDALRGGSGAVETIVAERSLDDVPWSIGIDEVADRVQITYQPADTRLVSDDTLTVWESTEVVTIRAGQTVTIEQDLDAAVSRLAPWYPVWWTGYPETRGSRWAASVQRDGGGTRPADTALEVTSTLLNPSRVRIRIKNTTTTTLYTAGTDGTTRLTLRANASTRPGEPRVISQGKSAAEATTPLDLDLGSWVQDDDVATEMLAWLAGTISDPLPTLTGVKVTPKASRRLGDVVRIQDPQYTSLGSKALIVGIQNAGSDGVLTQSLDLTILSTTFTDFNAWMTANGLTTFDALNAWMTANGITTFNQLNDFILTIGGLA